MTSPVLQKALEALARDIMNVAIEVSAYPRECGNEQWRDGYERGHRDARYAAVELVNAAFSAIQQQPEPVALTLDLQHQWKDAYAAFRGAFDTPQTRRQMQDDYSADARRRLREFDEAINAPPSLQQQEVPSEPSVTQDDYFTLIGHAEYLRLVEGKKDMPAYFFDLAGRIGALLGDPELTRRAAEIAASPSPTEQQEGASTDGVEGRS